MSLRRVLAMARKEFIQIRRDIRTLIAAVFIPLLLIFLFGYALSLDVDSIPTIILDADKTQASRDLVERISASRYFTLVGRFERQSRIDEAFKKRQALLALVIPAGFSAKLKRSKPVAVQAIFDGSDSNTATIATGYFNGIVGGFNLMLLKAKLQKAGARLSTQPLEPRVRVWFNPELKSRNFIVPGLSAVILMVICSLITALTIAREKETGTMEQLISTPVSSREIILGKLIPYLGIGFVDLWLVVFAAVWVFEVPFRGSYLILLVVGLIFLCGTLGWGLFISTVAKTQLEASQMVMLSVFLPSFLLSGFIYPIENMPLFLQLVTYIVPARYFVEILTGLFLKGVGLEVIWPQVLFLIFYATIVLNLAGKNFVKRIA